MIVNRLIICNHIIRRFATALLAVTSVFVAWQVVQDTSRLCIVCTDAGARAYKLYQVGVRHPTPMVFSNWRSWLPRFGVWQLLAALELLERSAASVFGSLAIASACA